MYFIILFAFTSTVDLSDKVFMDKLDVMIIENEQTDSIHVAGILTDLLKNYVDKRVAYGHYVPKHSLSFIEKTLELFTVVRRWRLTPKALCLQHTLRRGSK